MNTPIFPLILDEQEIFLLYKSIVTARQYKEIEFEETKDAAVLGEMYQLRQLINKVNFKSF